MKLFLKYYRLFIFIHIAAYILVITGWWLLDRSENSWEILEYGFELLPWGVAAMLIGSIIPSVILCRIADRRRKPITALQFISTSLLIILVQANAVTIFSMGEMITQAMFTALKEEDRESFYYNLVLHGAIFFPIVIGAFFQPKKELTQRSEEIKQL